MPLLPLVILLLLQIRLALFAAICTPAHDMMMTAAFVNIYSADINAQIPVLATSDGGAIYSATRGAVGSLGPHVIRVDAQGQFQWLTEVRAAGDTTNRYYPRALVGDEASGYLYLAGYITATYGGIPQQAFVMKYRMLDGGLINYYVGTKDAMCTGASIQALIMDSAGNLVFGGYYSYTATSYNLWIGTVSPSTLVPTAHSVSSAIDAPSKAFKLLEDVETAKYVVLGTARTMAPYLWIAGVDTATWATAWEYARPPSLAPIPRGLLKLRHNTYSFISSQLYYEVGAYTGFSAMKSAAGSTGMVSSKTDPDKFVLTGYFTAIDTNIYSFAYHYDPVANYFYKTGEYAKQYKLKLDSSSRYPTRSEIWATGYVMTTNILALIKIECTTPLVCPSGQTNYMNNNCYPSLATGCFGLCDTCLIAGDVNACKTSGLVSGSIADLTTSLFVARCAGGSYWQTYTGSPSCAAGTQTGCYELCGGECFSADTTKCMHHCKGISAEPYIDTSLLLSGNVCQCQAGRSLSAISLRCVYSSGCYALCAECGEPSDSSKCVGCIVGAHISATVQGAFTICVCEDGYALSGTLCLTCGTLCGTCDSPGDNSHCLTCANIANVEQTGTTAPYTCSCRAGTDYNPAGYCLYGTGCHPLCSGRCTIQGDASACFASCAPVVQGRLTGADSMIFTCDCPPGMASLLMFI